MSIRHWLPGILLCWSVWLQAAPLEQNITTWIYYENPPFIQPDARGFGYDFVDLLNRHGSGRFHFNLVVIPRVRLNQELIKGHQGVVLFVNPAWIDPDLPRRYLWTEPFLEDRNEVISSRFFPVDYQGPDSLQGLIFGSIRGHHYKPLEEHFIAGKLFRYDVNDESQVYRLLLAGRVDVTSQPRSMARALIQRLGVEEEVYFSPEPLQIFERHLMVTPQLTAVHQFLESLLPKLQHSEEWPALLERYQLDGIAETAEQEN